jgi:hypothetical protein
VRGVTAADDALVAAVEVVTASPARGGLVGPCRRRGRRWPDAAAFAVERRGDGDPPAGPRWPPATRPASRWPTGGRACRLGAALAPSIRLDVARLADGPWCGTAPFRSTPTCSACAACGGCASGGRRCRPQPDGGAGLVGWATAARDVRDVEVAIDVAPRRWGLVTRVAACGAARPSRRGEQKPRSSGLCCCRGAGDPAGAVGWFALVSSQTSAAARDRAGDGHRRGSRPRDRGRRAGGRTGPRRGAAGRPRGRRRSQPRHAGQRDRRRR